MIVAWESQEVDEGDCRMCQAAREYCQKQELVVALCDEHTWMNCCTAIGEVAE